MHRTSQELALSQPQSTIRYSSGAAHRTPLLATLKHCSVVLGSKRGSALKPSVLLLLAVCVSVQAGIDDTAYATGVTAGHIESVVETTKQQIAAVTDDIHVPPAELTTNTEDLLRQRQQQLRQ